VARLASGDLFQRGRCWWSLPLGHPWELVDYFDQVSGKWAARARCVRCGHETGLAIGTARRGAVSTSKALGTGVLSQSTPYAVPGSKRLGPSPVTGERSGFVVPAPEEGDVVVRHVRVRYPFGIRRTVYCAWRSGDDGPAAVSTELPVALARAVGGSPADEWVLKVARELENELTARA
jgi:hypothetical protein